MLLAVLSHGGVVVAQTLDHARHLLLHVLPDAGDAQRGGHVAGLLPDVPDQLHALRRVVHLAYLQPKHGADGVEAAVAGGLFPDALAHVVVEPGLRAAGGEALLQVLAGRAGDVVHLARAEVEVLHARARLADADARLGQLGAHVAAAEKYAPGGEVLLEDLLVAQAVLQRDNNRVGTGDELGRLAGHVGDRGLHHDYDYVHLRHALGGIGGLEARHVELAVGIAEDHAVRGNLVHVRLVRVYQPHLLRAALLQIAGEHTAGRAGTYHGYFHAVSLLPYFLQCAKIHA